MISHLGHILSMLNNHLMMAMQPKRILWNWLMSPSNTKTTPMFQVEELLSIKFAALRLYQVCMLAAAFNKNWATRQGTKRGTQRM